MFQCEAIVSHTTVEAKEWPLGKLYTSETVVDEDLSSKDSCHLEGRLVTEEDEGKK